MCFKKIKKILFSLLVVFFIIGCNEATLVNNISQNQALKIAGLLQSQGISAYITKDKQKKTLFNVIINKSDYKKAVIILNKNNLPKNEEPTIEEIIKQRSFLPQSPQMLRLKEDYLVSKQVKNMLLTNPNIVKAEVVVRNFSYQKDGDTTVSLMIVGKKSINKDALVNIIQNIIPSAQSNNIYVVFEQYNPKADQNNSNNILSSQMQYSKFLGVWNVAKEDKKQLLFFFIIFSIFSVLLGFLMGYYYHLKTIHKRWQSNKAMEIIEKKDLDKNYLDIRE